MLSGSPKLRTEFHVDLHELRTARRRAQVHIGRALGRLTVHEVVHALGPDVPHAGSGLMKATPNMRDLVVPDARLDASSSERFQQALQRRSETSRGS